MINIKNALYDGIKTDVELEIRNDTSGDKWVELKNCIEEINTKTINVKKETLGRMEEMTPRQIINFAIQKHQFYIDHPEKCSRTLGFKDWHEMWIKKYKNVLEDLEDYNDIIEEHMYRGRI